MKARTIAEWVSMPGPRSAVAREFRTFLQTYVDEHGNSVYGARIKRLGERK
jgi:DNA replication licensing factor MCM2